jgi:hypothetical protein
MTKLILILFDSNNDQDIIKVKDCLYCFFNVYLKNTKNYTIFERALFNSIDWTIRLSPNDSIKIVDIKQVANYFSNCVYFNAKIYQLADKIQFKLLEKMLNELEKENLNYFSKYLKFFMEFYADLDYEENRNDDMIEKIAISCKTIIVS